jgi:hypothetical protein
MKQSDNNTALPVFADVTPMVGPDVTGYCAAWCLEELTEIVTSASIKSKDGVIDGWFDLLGIVILAVQLHLGDDAAYAFKVWVNHQRSRGRSDKEFTRIMEMITSHLVNHSSYAELDDGIGVIMKKFTAAKSAAHRTRSSALNKITSERK